MEKIAKTLGLKDDATEEEIVAKIEQDKKELKETKEANTSLTKTNETLATSEAGKQARIDELEKSYRELSEKQTGEEKKEPKSDIDKLAEM